VAHQLSLWCIFEQCCIAHENHQYCQMVHTILHSRGNPPQTNIQWCKQYGQNVPPVMHSRWDISQGGPYQYCWSFELHLTIVLQPHGIPSRGWKWGISQGQIYIQPPGKQVLGLSGVLALGNDLYYFHIKITLTPSMWFVELENRCKDGIANHYSNLQL